MRITALMSAIAANRKQLFELVEALELETACEIDVEHLTEIIDGNYDGRDEISLDEACEVLMLVSRCVQQPA